MDMLQHYRSYEAAVNLRPASATGVPKASDPRERFDSKAVCSTTHIISILLHTGSV